MESTVTANQKNMPQAPASRKSAQRLINDLELVLRALRSRIPEEWFDLELTMPQLRVLFVLLQNGDSRMGTLASQLGISLSSATGLADRLVEKKLLDRWVDPDDRRSVICRLSQSGRELAERLLYSRRSWWEERLAALTEEEVCRAQEGLRALLDGLDRFSPSQQ